MWIVETSDWHTQVRASGKHPEMAGDANYSLEQIVDKCLELKQTTGEEVVLIGAGDLIDTPDPTPQTQVRTHAQFDRLAGAGIPLYHIQGQHERDMIIPRLAAHPWPQWINKKRVVLPGGFVIYGLDWQPIGVLQEELAKIPPDTNMLVAHQVWKEQMPPVAASEGSFTEVPHVQYILTGDLHKHQTTPYMITRPDGTMAGGLAISPGSIAMQAVDEPPAKLIYLMHVTPAAVELTEHPLRTRSFCSATLITEEDFVVFRDQTLPQVIQPRPDLPPELQRPQLVVYYEPTISEIVTKIQRAVGDTCHLFLKILERKVPISTLDGLPLQPSADVSLLGCLGVVVPPDTPMYHGAHRLLSVAIANGNIDAEITKMEQEFITSFASTHENPPSPICGSVPAPQPLSGLFPGY